MEDKNQPRSQCISSSRPLERGRGGTETLATRLGQNDIEGNHWKTIWNRGIFMLIPQITNINRPKTVKVYKLRFILLDKMYPFF